MTLVLLNYLLMASSGQSDTLRGFKLLIFFISPGVSPGWRCLCYSRRPVSDPSHLVGVHHHYNIQRSLGDGCLEEGGGLLHLHSLDLLPDAPAGGSCHLLRLRAEGEAATSAVPGHAQQQYRSLQRQLLPPGDHEVRPLQVERPQLPE